MAKKVKIKSKKPQGIGSKIFDVVNYLLLAILGFIMFYPMFYVFIVSISSSFLSCIRVLKFSRLSYPFFVHE